MTKQPNSLPRLIGVLAEAFRQTISEATLMAYEIGLKDIPLAQVELAVVKAIRTCRFMPTVKDLRELATGTRDSDRPVLAWDAVLAVPLNPYKHIDFDDPLINATIRNLGGWPSFTDRFNDSESEKWVRKEFLETYQKLLSSGVNGDACRPLPGLSEVTGINGKVVPCVPMRIATGLPALPEGSVRPQLKTAERLNDNIVPKLKKA